MDVWSKLNKKVDNILKDTTKRKKLESELSELRKSSNGIDFEDYLSELKKYNTSNEIGNNNCA